MALIQGFFSTCHWYFYFQYHQHSGQSKIFQNLFHLIRSFTEINELTVRNFPGVYHLKMVCEKNFLRLTVTGCFQKMSTSKMWIFLLFLSVTYNNVVITKQIYFSSTFLKSWVHISDNIAGVVGGTEHY